jgi:two-component system phosphate regulon response regulator OmpR
MLTALADAEDRISGLEAGVDDVSKPFEPVSCC